MISEIFWICRERNAGGVLSGIFHHSMSLNSAVERGAMPPLEVFNAFMACGYHDVEHAGCIDVDQANMRGAVLEWEPFALTATEYEAFLAYLRSIGKRFEVVDYGTSEFGEWFTKCFC